MITYQLNSNRNFAKICLAIPHTAASVVGHIFLVKDAISSSVAGDHIMGMTAIGASTVAQAFPFRNNAQRCFKTEL
jgi:hypothetical protein